LGKDELKKEFFENVNQCTQLKMDMETQYTPCFIIQIFNNSKNEELDLKNIKGTDPLTLRQLLTGLLLLLLSIPLTHN
jgi:hypothetical protein